MLCNKSLYWYLREDRGKMKHEEIEKRQLEQLEEEISVNC